jgi:carboxymethylenebutenolidase
MGGRHALAAAVAAPHRVAFAASIHGGRLVTADDQSPHRLIARCPGRLYFAFARDDETCPAAHQEAIEREAALAGHRVRCERYDALHGWSFPQRECFDRAASERVYERVLRMAREELWSAHRPRD